MRKALAKRTGPEREEALEEAAPEQNAFDLWGYLGLESGGDVKAWTLGTTLEELKCHEERVGVRFRCR